MKKTFAAIWTGWVVAAVFAVVASYLGALWITTRSQLRIEKDQAELASLESRSLEQSIEANRIVTDRQIADLQGGSSLDHLKIAQLRAPESNSPQAAAIAIWNPLKQEGVLFVQDLPSVSEYQSYQLWVIDAHRKEPVSGAVFDVDPHGRARVNFHPTAPTDAATEFIISRERKGGAPAPQGPSVATGSLQ